MMATGLYEARGKALTNFSKRLPLPQSDLAQQTLKDPYNFDFLTMRDGYVERELEDALTENITKFLLELGHGFAYVGRQDPHFTRICGFFKRITWITVYNNR